MKNFSVHQLQSGQSIRRSKAVYGFCVQHSHQSDQGWRSDSVHTSGQTFIPNINFTLKLNAILMVEFGE
ncbi:unnamed protein product, partial [Nesidiocoris tenuis]